MAEEGPIPMPTFKCVLIGDAGPVKSAFAGRMKNGGFPDSEVNTQGVEVRSLVFYTTRGPLRFNVWDAAGEEKYEELREGDRVQSECAVIMFDDAESCHEKLRKAYQNVPTILCGTKAGLKDVNKQKTRLQYFYDIDSRNKYSFVYPFLWIATQLVGDDQLEFVPMPAVFPADCKEDKEIRLQMERFLEKAMNIPLPPDDGKW